MCIAHTDLYLTLKLKVGKSEENTLCSNVINTFPPLLPVDLGCHSQLWQCTFNVACPTIQIMWPGFQGSFLRQKSHSHSWAIAFHNPLAGILA